MQEQVYRPAHLEAMVFRTDGRRDPHRAALRQGDHHLQELAGGKARLAGGQFGEAFGVGQDETLEGEAMRRERGLEGESTDAKKNFLKTAAGEKARHVGRLHE